MTGSLNLAGRRALITGSFQGIGLAIAESLASEGVAIVLHGLANSPGKTDAINLIKGAGNSNVIAVESDLRNHHETEKMIGEVLNTGNIDILVNNAGIQHTATIEDMPRERWDDILAVNLSSMFDTARLALPGMVREGYGRIINIASVHGLVASVAKAPYVAAKHGVVGLTKVIALEYAAKGNPEVGGITANSISPGWVETSLIEPQIQARVDKHQGDRAAGIADLLSEKQPSKRMSKPHEIGELVKFLCLPTSHNITGASIPIDGGWTAQ